MTIGSGHTRCSDLPSGKSLCMRSYGPAVRQRGFCGRHSPVTIKNATAAMDEVLSSRLLPEGAPREGRGRCQAVSQQTGGHQHASRQHIRPRAPCKLHGAKTIRRKGFSFEHEDDVPTDSGGKATPARTGQTGRSSGSHDSEVALLVTLHPGEPRQAASEGQTRAKEIGRWQLQSELSLPTSECLL